MAAERTTLLFFLLPLLFNFSIIFTLTDAAVGSIGINYGRIANNLPSATKVVTLLKSQGFDRVKVYDTDPSVLRALANSGIKVTVDLPNQLLRTAATHPSFAHTWVLRNVAAYFPHTAIESIAVGNEVFVDPSHTTNYLIQAMENIHTALRKTQLDTHIKVSSPIALSAIKSSYPPSTGAFLPELIDTVFKPMLAFLRRTDSFLMVNAYPFLAYEANRDVISLDYALFRPNRGVVDSGSGLTYYSLFDAEVDAVFAAMSALNYNDVPIIVTETGWPSKGDENEFGASVENAATYNGNLVKRVLNGGGTPLRPKANLTVLLFALFNENQKPGPTSERNFGLFYPDMRKVYDIPLTFEEVMKRQQQQPRDGKPAEEDGPRRKGGRVSQARKGGSGSGGGAAGGVEQSWCVANNQAGEEKLQAALDYACGEGGADCRQIQPGATCYDPNTIEAHASYAFNSYYQKSSRAVGSCDFQGAAYVVSHPPKYGSCELPTGY